MSSTIWDSSAAVIRIVADYIERHGLARGKFGTLGGPCCVIGTVRSVMFGNPHMVHNDHNLSLYREIYQALDGYAHEHHLCSVFEWSDSCDVEVVVRALRKISREEDR